MEGWIDVRRSWEASLGVIPTVKEMANTTAPFHLSLLATSPLTAHDPPSKYSRLSESKSVRHSGSLVLRQVLRDGSHVGSREADVLVVEHVESELGWGWERPSRGFFLDGHQLGGQGGLADC